MSDDNIKSLVDALRFRDAVFKALPPIDEEAQRTVDELIAKSMNRRPVGYTPLKLKRKP